MARPLAFPFAIAAMVVAAALAGCIGTAAASAMENRNAADDAARAWNPDARLAQVVGVEGTFSLGALAMGMMGASGSSGDFDQASEDEEVGDGKAEVWLYRYVAAGEPKAFVVVLDKAGDVLRSGEETDASTFGTAVGRWDVDSDAALEIAKTANEGLAKGAGSEHYGIIAILHHEDGRANPTWMIMGGGADAMGGGGGFVEIDAVSGKVLQSEGGFGDLWRR